MSGAEEVRVPVELFPVWIPRTSQSGAFLAVTELVCGHGGSYRYDG